MFYYRVKASGDWAHLRGKFLINGWPSKVVVYLEGPPPGTEILVTRFKVKRTKKLLPFKVNRFFFHGIIIISQIFWDITPMNMFLICFQPPEKISLRSISQGSIILNPEFSEGMSFWHASGCQGRVVSSSSARTGQNFAVVSNRTESWQGLEQDITDRITIDRFYIVSSWIKVSGGHDEECEVLATIKLEWSDSTATYQLAGK